MAMSTPRRQVVVRECVIERYWLESLHECVCEEHEQRLIETERALLRLAAAKRVLPLERLWVVVGSDAERPAWRRQQPRWLASAQL